MTVGTRPSPGWLGSRRGRTGPERIIPPALCVLVAAALYAVLPQSLFVGPRFVISGVLLLLLVALLITSRWRNSGRAQWSRIISIVLALVVIVANLVALGFLVASLGDKDADATAMLFGAMEVWVTNVIGFALLYWEIDRGGPVVRHTAPRELIPLADWRFSQDENHDTVVEVKDGGAQDGDWAPNLVDYLYLSLTNSSAFSPTDSMPLSARAKLLMGTQATAALLTSLLVVARAVGSLGQ